ncbi:SPBc2 prophage-derived uncharacterized transglycosylase yomI [Mycena kentingensis (nom. inval.)]|nr:SPBc2 prophage-derived uncharacterized transglycosylase yomI [Mycena kentingensis (nom. inval.)]
MLLAIPLVILASALAVQASIAHDAHNHIARHHRIARNPEPETTPAVKLRRRKSCKTPNTSKTPTTTTTTKKKAATTTKKDAEKATPKANALVNKQSPAGTIKVQVDRCGDNGASTKISNTAGPNGRLSWLNCGLEGMLPLQIVTSLIYLSLDGGWNPPFMSVDDIVVEDLSVALKSSSSPFHACKPFMDIFYEAADKYNLQPIMLAAFAMQESSCDPKTVGGGGEQGLMQITKDKCGGAPGGNCRDPYFNIMAGAKYFAKTLENNNGNFLLSLGQYNGWSKGLTVEKATAARWTSCCLCQNNLDYLHQYMNGWILNQNAYALNLGKYHNLEVCRH